MLASLPHRCLPHGPTPLRLFGQDFTLATAITANNVSEETIERSLDHARPKTEDLLDDANIPVCRKKHAIPPILQAAMSNPRCGTVWFACSVCEVSILPRVLLLPLLSAGSHRIAPFNLQHFIAISFAQGMHVLGTTDRRRVDQVCPIQTR